MGRPSRRDVLHHSSQRDARHGADRAETVRPGGGGIRRANPKKVALECADRTEQFIAQFDVPKRLRDAGVPRNELNDIVGPITRELQHNGVVDRPLTEEEVLALLESCY